MGKQFRGPTLRSLGAELEAAESVPCSSNQCKHLPLHFPVHTGNTKNLHFMVVMNSLP